MAALPSRLLLKLSGEVLGGADGVGLDSDALARIAGEIAEGVRAGHEIGIVLGGGNFLRGADVASESLDRVAADQMGMLATVLNGIALASALRTCEVRAAVMSAIPAGTLTEPYGAWRARERLATGQPVILVGGSGNPLFTTDTCAALRGVEIGATKLLKGTKVDGIYTADPKTDPSAERLDRLTFQDALTRDLRVMDRSAFSLCMDHSLPVRVFDMTQPGNIRRALVDQDLGSEVHVAVQTEEGA